MYDPGPKPTLPEQEPDYKPSRASLFLGLTVLLVALALAIGGVRAAEPRNSVRERPAPAELLEIVQPVPMAVPVIDTYGDHCLLDEDRCTQVAQDTCRQAANLPVGTRVKLLKKTFEMGKLCTFTCPNGTSYSCSAPQLPKPKPEDVTLTPPTGVTVLSDGRWLMPCVSTRETITCPPGVVCLYPIPERKIQDGPDVFPTGEANRGCLYAEPW